MNPPIPRLGPRPLSLHLASAATIWMSSRLAWPLLKNGSLAWSPDLAAVGNALLKSLGENQADPFLSALDGEIVRRQESFLTGIERYRHHPYRRNLIDPYAIWTEGTTRLLDYGPEGGAPILVIPSLINRGYILDLAEGKSLMRFLTGRGLRPLLIDWGKPGEAERDFDLTRYIARLGSAADAMRAATGQKLAILGYCMGGLLAVALGQARPDLVRALALLATPWDFHAERAEQARLLGSLAGPLTRSFGALNEVPVDVLQTFFMALDPLNSARKFMRFGALPQGAPGEAEFVALEDWLNDGIPLAMPVMREALAGWYGDNLPGQGQWLVDGRPVVPEEIDLPSLLIVPRADRIVPPATAAALADRLPDATRPDVSLGHIGMMVGHSARGDVWEPLATWLLR